MPGLLKPDAWCPLCGRDVLILSRTTRHEGPRTTVILEFDHGPEYPQPHAMRGEAEQMDRIHARLHAAISEAP